MNSSPCHDRCSEAARTRCDLALQIANCVWDYVARPFSLSAGNEGGPKGDALVNKLDFGTAATQTDRRGKARQDEARQVEAI